jgi:hypothetical protein
VLSGSTHSLPLQGAPVPGDGQRWLFSSSATYARPAAAYIALWQILGTARFTQVLRGIQREYGSRSITEPELEAAFQQGLPGRSRACRTELTEFFTQWFDTAYPAAGGATEPSITGPGLDGPGFSCKSA